MSLLRQVLLKTSIVKPSSNTVKDALKTLRYKLFAKPAYNTIETDIGYDLSYATASMGARFVGLRYNSQLSRDIYLYLSPLINLYWKISV